MTSRYTERVHNLCSEHAQEVQHFPKSFSISVDKQRQLNLVSWFTVSWKADYPAGKMGKKRQDIHMYAQHNHINFIFLGNCFIATVKNMAFMSYFMTPNLP